MSAKSVPGRPLTRAATRPTDRRAALRRLAADLAIALAAVAAAAVALLLGDATAAHAAVPGPVLAAEPALRHHAGRDKDLAA